MNVYQIPTEEAIPWILKRHYARRIPSISWAFGLFDGVNMVGIATYGTPASSTLLKGVCGTDYASQVIELNRVVCSEGKNQASMVIGQSLRLLPKPKIVVSYADSAVGHVGKIYQATNWIYTGLSTLTYDPVIKGQEGKHHATSGAGRGLTKVQMVEKFGDDVYWKPRSRKHRYIYFVGNKRQRRDMLKALRYEILPYPKGESMRYDASAEITTQPLLFAV